MKKILISVLLYFCLWFIDNIFYTQKVEDITVSITKIQRVTISESDHTSEFAYSTRKFLIDTETETLENSESTYFRKHYGGVTEIQDKIQVGGTYRVKVSGHRSYLFFRYRNILEVIEQ